MIFSRYNVTQRNRSAREKGMNDILFGAKTAKQINQCTLRSIQNGIPISDRDAMLVREHFLRHALEPGTEEHKFFFEEFQPATIVAEYYGGGFQLQFGGKQNEIDCRLQKNGDEIRLEMTLAEDGHSEAINWEHFEKYGHLSVFEEVNYTGNKKNRKIEEQGESTATSCDEIDQKYSRLVLECLQRKIKKAGSCQNYSQAILVVTINDYKFPVSTVNERFQPVFSRASSGFSSIAPFENFLGVCWSGNCIFDRSLAI